MTDTTPTYCTPEYVANVLGLPDRANPASLMKFSDQSIPTYDYVCELILAAEDEIDLRLKRSWRENTVTEYLTDISEYQWDENGWRSMYMSSGGYTIQLRRNIREWDPDQGDKLELRDRYNTFTDISDGLTDSSTGAGGVGNLFWFDYPAGRLFLRTKLAQPKLNSLRITYRYGSTEAVPAAIKRLCGLIVASNILTSDFYSIKVGTGGDISGLRDSALKRWEAEEGRIYTAFQRTGAVHSLLR